MMEARLMRPALGNIRLAEHGDVSAIMNMVNDSMANTFRINHPGDIANMLESGVLCIVQLDIYDAIIGFIGTRDYPLILSLHPSAWEEYVWTKYRTIELNARNTLFIHLLCWNPIYSRELVDNMLKSIFMHDAYLNYIVMVKTLIQYPLLVQGQSRSEGSFKRVQAMERGISGDLLPMLSIADRKEVSPRLRIRRAVEEDNDDIVPIIERQSPRLQEMYGEFYVSELISRHPESERVLLVCEHKELAVGVMCLNTQINYEELEESFELSPFAGLRHLESVKHKPNKVLDMSLESASNMMDRMSMSIPFDFTDLQKEAKSKVTWVLEDGEIKEISRSSSPIGSQASNDNSRDLSAMDIVSLFGDDDDELDFDIVNIDTELLKLPEMLSYDMIITGISGESVSKILKVNSPAEDEQQRKKDSMNKYKRIKPLMADTTKPPLIEPARYIGRPNAFLIELFAMHEDYDERYGFDMLEAAYELFPDRDYCIICLPSKHPAFPLLEHFTLVTPYGTRLRYINETLYVAHINSVRGNIRIRPTEHQDMVDMSNILEHAPRRQTLTDILESTLTSLTFESYTFLSQNQPIGVVVLGPFEDNAAMRSQFKLDPEPRRAGSDGSILIGVVSPCFEPHVRWYIRELLRYSRFSTLFWNCSLFGKGDSSARRNLMSLAQHMVPVTPRLSLPNISEFSLDNIAKESSVPFALWVIERPMTSLPKALINNSIVVVGASCTGLAFLETLFMGPSSRYLTFTNVTLVSEHGLPTVSECLRAADICVPRVGRYTFKRLKCIPFHFYLDVVPAIMMNIDRKKKCIHLKGGEVKFYDELVLTCGKQFQHPEYMSESLEIVKEVEKGNPCERMLMDNPQYQPDRVPLPPEVPDNLMIINSLYEANICLKRLLRMISEAKDTSLRLCVDNPVIVYGDCIEAYTCMTALLELGLSAKMINFVEPFPIRSEPKMRVNCFNNETVDEKVQASLSYLGIKVYRQCEMSGWRIQNNAVMDIRLMSPLHCINLPCFALFYYGIRAINLYAFKAINESGLVYDGGLTVGPAFDTNDPNIYAAGKCCQYSRRLYSKYREHEYYSSEDIGEELAKLFLRKLDPFVVGNPEYDPADLLPRIGSMLLSKSSSTLLSDASKAPIRQVTSARISIVSRGNYKWQPVMRFQSPLVISATFPGPLYYMTLRKPGPNVPMEVQLTLPEQGHTLLTDVNGNYFRLTINILHCISSIACLTVKPFSSEILTRTYGKHEAYFNKLLVRFMENQIPDLFEYFVQPWMGAMYQEVFDDLIDDINSKRIGTVYDLVKSKFSMEKMEGTLGDTDDSLSPSRDISLCTNVPSCGFEPEEAKSLGTFRSILGNFLVRKSSVNKPLHYCSLIESQECGQNAGLRTDARAFWNVIGGEDIVTDRIENQIPDLFEYFVQPWMGAMYQEVFDDLIDDINSKRIGTVYDLVKSKFSMEKMEGTLGDTDDSLSPSRDISLCTNVPSCGFEPEEAKSLGTFRSILGNFLVRKSSVNKPLHYCSLIESQECGQNAGLRTDARAFWNVIGGEDIVTDRIVRHLSRYSVVNPQYASCD